MKPGPDPRQRERCASYAVTPGATHGKPSTYKRGCRCSHCRSAWAIYRRDKNRAYRERKARERKLAAARALLREAGEL